MMIIHIIDIQLTINIIIIIIILLLLLLLLLLLVVVFFLLFIFLWRVNGHDAAALLGEHAQLLLDSKRP